MIPQDLVQFVRGASYEEAVEHLELELQQSNFKLVHKNLAAVFFSSQVDDATSLDFVIHCLLYCQDHLEATSPGLKHLLLELITPEAAANATSAVKAAAVQLFHAYCTVQDAKLAAKVALIFKLSRIDLTDWDQVTIAVQQLLHSQTSYKAAVHIMMQFEGMDEVVDKSDVITQLVAGGQENLCQQWVTSLGKDYQVEFVEACVALDRLKPAARAVRQLGLQAEFPNIEALYRQRSLARLVGKRLWSVALSFVGSDTALQTSLVRDMADMGEISLAEEYRKQLGLPESVLTVDPEQVALQEAARREQYIQIDQYLAGDEQLLFVVDEAGLRQASEVLSGSDVLGLDVEWKPSHVAGVMSPAAILQVASRHSAVLFDLITLAQQHPAALDACLQPLFSSAGVLKLGFEVSGDLAKLANSWPQVEAFSNVAGVLDLKPLWVAFGVNAKRQGGSVRLLSAIGLSSLCKALLGKALDKSQQMSDWTARPLTARQLQYAALDALVLPQLYDVLCNELGPQKQQKLLQQHVQTFLRQTQTNQAALVAAGRAVAYAAGETAAARVSDDHQQELVSCSPAAAGSVWTNAADSTSNTVSDALQAQQEPGLPRVLSLLQKHGMEDTLYWLNSNPVQIATPHTLGAAGFTSSVSVPRSHVAKTMAVLIDREPLLVVTRGDQRIDMHKLAAVLGVRRKVIRLAPDSMAQEITGFAPGGIPPLGYGSKYRIIIDQHLNPATALAATNGNGQVVHNVYHLQPAKLAELHHVVQHTVQQEDLQCRQQTDLGLSISRFSGVVAAATLLQTAPQVSHSHHGKAQIVQSDDSAVGSCSYAWAGCRSGSSHSANTSNSSPSTASGNEHLYVQCGRHCLAVLKYRQLLDLTEGQIADVAEVPDGEHAPAAAAAGTGQRGLHQLDPHFSGGQQSVPCFLVDSMLGRLCRWLRALGVDAQFVDPGGTLQQRQQLTAADRAQQQNSLIQQIQDAALQEGRLFLTRDSKLAARRDVGGSVYLLDTDDTAQQLSEISKHFGIRFDEQTAMSRCSNCNAAMFQLISREEAAAHVPQRVMDLVEEFWKCGKCGKVFWMGPKSYAALELLGGLFTDGKVKPTPLQSSLQRDE